MTKTLTQNLTITYSNQRARDLRLHGDLGAFDCMTLMPGEEP